MYLNMYLRTETFFEQSSDTYGEGDQVSLQSEDTESVHSTAEISESAAVDEIVNQQGVRFTPHHHQREGMTSCLDSLLSLFVY